MKKLTMQPPQRFYWRHDSGQRGLAGSLRGAFYPGTTAGYGQELNAVVINSES